MRKKLEDLIFTYSDFIKQRYGEKVFRVGLSTGIQCPHRDKTGGCVFCNPETFTGDYQSDGLTVTEQLEKAVPGIKQTTGAISLLAYFQDETSTAGDLEYLDKVFRQALEHEDIIGLIVSTRPDYVNQAVLELLNSFKVPVNLEIGLQTIHEDSLKFINRGHTMAAVEQAIQLAQKNKIDLGIHIVIGIPGETVADMQRTIKYLSSKPAVKEVKFHNLVIYKNTLLADIYQQSEFGILTIDKYIEILCDLLPWLRGDIVVSRLFTSNIRRSQIAIGKYQGSKPEWLNKLRLALLKKNVFQGSNTDTPYRPELDIQS